MGREIFKALLCATEMLFRFILYSKITFTKFPVVVVVVFCTVKSNFLNPPNTTVFSANTIYCMQAATHILLLRATSC